jgi:hypothetical protein
MPGFINAPIDCEKGKSYTEHVKCSVCKMWVVVLGIKIGDSYQVEVELENGDKNVTSNTFIIDATDQLRVKINDECKKELRR